MRQRSIAEHIVYGAFDIVAQKAKEDPVKVFERALGNVKPKLEVKSRRVGGSTYQVPVDVRPERSQALGMRWLVTYARERGEKTMREKLAAELVDASANRGNACKKREDTPQDGGSQQGLRPLSLVGVTPCSTDIEKANQH